MSIENTSNNVEQRRHSGVKSRVKSGRWTQTEKLTFLVGLKKFGRGKWKEIATLIPSRSTVQVKTHAQMVMKRVEAGEDVFEDLRHLTTEQSTEVLRDDCKSIPTTSAMNVKIKSNRSCRDKVMKPFQAYDTLTRRDQGAVMILCQMWKTR